MYSRFLLALFAACFLAAPPLLAQTRVDSLETQLQQAPGEARLPVLVDLVEALYRDESEQALVYGREAHALLTDETTSDLVRRLWYWSGLAHDYLGQYDSLRAHGEQLRAWGRARGDTLGIAEGTYMMGRSHWRQGNQGNKGANERAIELLEEALVGYMALGENRAATVLSTIGAVQYNQAAFAEALGAFERMHAIAEANGDRPTLARALNNMGLMHKELGNYDDALTLLMQSLAIKEEFGDPRDIANTLNNIGLIHKERGFFDDALAFFNRALVLNEAVSRPGGMSANLVNIAEIQRMQEAYDEALVTFERARALREALGSQRGVAYVLTHVGITYKEMGRYDEALAAYRRAFAIREALDDRQSVTQLLLAIGDLHLVQGQLNEALASTDEALALAEASGVLRFARDAHEQRTTIFEQQERFAEALTAHKAYKAAHDSLFSSESQGVISELQEQYRTREQQQRIALLESEQQVQRLWLGGLVVGLILLALIAFLVYNRYRLKNSAHTALTDAHTALTAAHDDLRQTHAHLRQAQQRLIHAEKMASLGALTAGIAHEIKNPLNFINNFAEVSVELVDELAEEMEAIPALSDRAADFEEILADLRQNTLIIAQHGRRADGIVHSMMQHASGGEGRREAVEVNRLVSEHVALAWHGKRSQEPALEVEIVEDLDPAAGRVEGVPQELGRVVLNLLSNAFDAVAASAEDGAAPPRVTVTTRRDGAAVEIRVEDNGPGIPEDVRARIFEPFFTTKPTGSGTGLGLSMAFDIVTQGHGGMLDVAEADGGGAAFVVRLPVASKASVEMPAEV